MRNVVVYTITIAGFNDKDEHETLLDLKRDIDDMITARVLQVHESKVESQIGMYEVP